MKKTTLLALLLFLVPVALGAVTLTEDFEDETPGNPPSTTFGTWTTGANTDIFEVRAPLTGGNEFNTQALVISGDGGANGGATLTLTDAQQYNTVSFAFSEDDYNYGSVALSDTSGSNLASFTYRADSPVFGDPDHELFINGPKVATCTTEDLNVSMTNINYASNTFDVIVDNADASNCYTATGVSFQTSVSELGKIRVSPYRPGTMAFDDLVVSLLETPDPPQGIRAEVTDSVASPKEFKITVALSPDDPDPIFAQYEYTVYYNDGGDDTAIATFSPGAATEGVFEDLVTISTSEAVTFYANVTTPLDSGPSCTVTVTSTTQGETDQCGSGITGYEETGSDLTGPDGALFGGDRSALATALQVSETGLSYLMGLMVTLLFAAGGFMAYRFIGAALFGVIGVVFSAATGLFSFWVLYVFAFLLVGGGVLYSKMNRSVA